MNPEGKMNRAMGEIKINPLSKRYAEALADELRERYKAFPHFQVAVFVDHSSPKSDDEGEIGTAYVVRTNLVNGLPPLRHTDIKAPDAKNLKWATQLKAVA
jgi:hypothetical protein